MELSRTRKRLILFLLVLIGLGSALLTVRQMLAGIEWPPGFKGLLFGLSICLVLVFARKESLRAPVRLLLFTVCCVAADLASLFIAVGTDLIVGRGRRHTDMNTVVPIPGVVYFVAGFAGAAIVLLSASALFTQSTFGKQWGRPLIFALAAGGATAQAPSLKVMWYQGANVDANAGLTSILLWQSCVALFIGFTILDAQAKPGYAQDSKTHEKPARLTLCQLAVLIPVLSFLGWYVWSRVQAELVYAGRQRVLDRIIQKAPAGDSHIELHGRQLEAVLILKEVAGLSVEHAFAAPISAHPLWRSRLWAPSRFTYSANYSRGNGRQWTRVEITEYPSRDWAHYLAEFPIAAEPGAYKANCLSKGKIFDAGVFMDTCHLFSLEDGAQTFVWPSANFAIVISSENGAVNADILKRYLALYPSLL